MKVHFAFCSTLSIMESTILFISQKKGGATMHRRTILVFLWAIIVSALLFSACSSAEEPVSSPYADITGFYPYPQQTGQPGLYVRTLPCPMDLAAYAADHLESFVRAHLSDPSFVVGDGQLTVGQPFSFCNEGSDIFYFPVLLEDEIILLLRTWKSESTGKCSGILSAHLASELSALAPLTTPETPLSLVKEGYDTTALIEGQTHLLHSSPPESGALVLADEEATLVTDLFLSNTVVNLALDTAECRADP